MESRDFQKFILRNTFTRITWEGFKTPDTQVMPQPNFWPWDPGVSIFLVTSNVARVENHWAGSFL